GDRLGRLPRNLGQAGVGVLPRRARGGLRASERRVAGRDLLAGRASAARSLSERGPWRTSPTPGAGSGRDHEALALGDQDRYDRPTRTFRRDIPTRAARAGPSGAVPPGSRDRHRRTARRAATSTPAAPPAAAGRAARRQAAQSDPCAPAGGDSAGCPSRYRRVRGRIREVEVNREPGAARHVPVLLRRADELLGPALAGEDAIYVDATLGLGGHAEHFLRTYPRLRLIGLDRDTEALRLAGERLAPFADRITLVHTRYDGIADALAGAGLDPAGSVAGVLMDLGVSSMQL